MNLKTLDLNILLVFEVLMDERNVTRATQAKEGSRMRLPEQVSKKREVTSSAVAEVMKGQLLGVRLRDEALRSPLAAQAAQSHKLGAARRGRST